ncbi:ABC-F family ATP-binding cassette domain-containing protein [Dictyobacter arantiisoli]|uniref:ABC transporter ATP-binding protein n=1 Tax=Dictyobacter arantiisoli TaxID=2014874 RepID=A0A5A5T917_9CHLR|nr:ABC-F family ATP-binding cassette domain-containing protein [Dictyobacter arantiisoli]GCF07765.1 ABC transporter ATP-binding protein [Dictyobacter arantiisoli]
MLQVNHIKLSYGPRVILDDISFTVAPGEKAGLIGVNGAGKSSLLKIIGGYQEAERGNIMRPRTYGYLSQDVAHETPVSAHGTVRDFIYSGTGLDAAIAKYEELSMAIADPEIEDLDAALQEFEEAQTALDVLGYYDADARSEQLISGLNIGGVTLDRETLTLSGGQKTKLALVRLLFQAPELLLLDEPTNFLDVEATMWLMEFLETYKGALLIISHDLDLLDNSINKVLRLNEFTHKLEEYKGNYTSYLNAIGDAQALAERTKRQQEREISRLKKTSDRLRGFGATRVKQRIAMDRRISTLEENKPQMAQTSKKMHIDFPVRQQSGHMVVQARELCKSYGQKIIFNDISFLVDRGERMVVIGLNGVGKTTLLRTVLGLVPPTSGKVEIGDRVDISYYAQESEGLDYENTVINEANDVLPTDARRVRSVLGRFLFNGDRVFQKIKTLSGGEKTRLALAKMVLEGSNVLVLDEPTSHLDMMSKEIIGEALGNYSGTILTVTHDVDFVRLLKPTSLLLMPEGRLVPYDSKYDEMLERA